MIVAVGDPSKIREVVHGSMYVEKDDTFVVSSENADILTRLKEAGINAYTFKQYKKILTTNLKNTPLQRLETSHSFDWQKTGLEFLAVSHTNTFEVFTIDKKDVKSIMKVEPVASSIFSNTGALVGFIRRDTVSFHLNDSLDLICDFKFTESILKITFDPKDKFAAVELENSVRIFDIFKGVEVLSFPTQPYFFIWDGVLYEKSFSSSDDLMQQKKNLKETKSCSSSDDMVQQKKVSRETEFFSLTDDSKMLQPKIDKILKETMFFASTDETKFLQPKIDVKNNKLAVFVDGKLQKIFFITQESETVKNHSNVKDTRFYFSSSRLFVLITKSINQKDCYILESYCDGEITTNPLDCEPVYIAVSDGSFVVYDTSNTLSFYQKYKYSYKKVKSIRKDSEVLVSIKNQITVVVDSSNVEFYDGTELRAVYTHIGCNRIVWSESGLYVATVTITEETGGLVQIFNCNGQLMFKKVFSRPSEFQWRPFIQKNYSKELIEDEEESEEDSGDAEALLSEWKGYLLSKIQQSLDIN